MAACLSVWAFVWWLGPIFKCLRTGWLAERPAAACLFYIYAKKTTCTVAAMERLSVGRKKNEKTHTYTRTTTICLSFSLTHTPTHTLTRSGTGPLTMMGWKIKVRLWDHSFLTLRLCNSFSPDKTEKANFSPFSAECTADFTMRLKLKINPAHSQLQASYNETASQHLMISQSDNKDAVFMQISCGGNIL